MIKTKVPLFGKNSFPTSSAHGNMGRIGVTPLLRCQQCGFVNDSRNTAWAKQGDGLVNVPFNGVSGDPTTEQVVRAGCAFCGSLKWRYKKPPKLQDDIRLSDGHTSKYKKKRR